ncbi:hypothetical protein [Streptomyces sp. NPDC014733]|uniref:hypothetical protein n=1 Tax=Streptomyces sp. NPDC014733 TaxID=3364885 RepID=UPI003700AB8A
MTVTTDLLPLAPTDGAHDGPQLCVRRGGPGDHFRLGFVDERPGHRDLRDVLWDPTAPAEQRAFMLYLTCVMCGQPVRQIHSTRPKVRPGLLFLVPGGADTSQSVRTVLPPVCLAHARIAARESAALQHGHTALLVARHRLHGVIGTRYRWAGHQVQQLPPAPETDALPVPYGSYNARWTLARLLVRELTEHTAVDLDDSAHLAEAP